MSRLPIVDYSTIAKLLAYLGFEPIRQKGSHVFFRHPGRDLARPLVRDILRDMEISPSEFVEYLSAL
jgi:predicted RNA binding protein YcfA (HicA-like mRNA interferase family)